MKFMIVTITTQCKTNLGKIKKQNWQVVYTKSILYTSVLNNLVTSSYYLIQHSGINLTF